MNSIILALGIFFMQDNETAFMPEPTKEIKALILQLGDDSFKVREKADKELLELGWPALKGLADAIKNSEDAEIRSRAVRIYQSYFNLGSDKDNLRPGIWHLNEKTRFPNGIKPEFATQDFMGSVCKTFGKEVKDVAREYYERAMIDLKLVKNGVGEVGWQNEDVARHATYLYIKDQLKVGKKREDVKKYLNLMADNAKKYDHYYQTDNIETPINDWHQLPPGPMIEKGKFREPSWGP